MNRLDRLLIGGAVLFTILGVATLAAILWVQR